MMKSNTFTFIILIAGIFILGLLLPWWVSPLWIILIAYIRKTTFKSGIVMGAISLGFVWGIVAGYMTFNDDADIMYKTGQLLGGVSGNLLIIITALIGSITGGLAGWFGSALNKNGQLAIGNEE